ncbi:MAG TPA: VOC family protein [Anaerolineales bacterium]|nr:VOC family protein [Anaerolineales bacterium]
MVLDMDQKTKINPKTTVGAVLLGVRDFEQMTEFYRNVIGLDVLDRSTSRVSLGIDSSPLVVLEHRPDGQAYPMAPGLFHLAILMPSRQDLGHWLEHFSQLGHRLSGVGDHLVSEALYLNDPEGNGIEIYRDRPRQDWQYDEDGGLQMDTLAIDVYALLEDAHRGPFNGMPKGTKMGHVHLQVNELQAATAFYRDVVGFDMVTRMPSASFLSAGGYHHHLGMNTWRSRNAEPRPVDALGLIAYQVVLPDEDALKTHLSEVEARGGQIDTNREFPQITDPSGNVVQFIHA